MRRRPLLALSVGLVVLAGCGGSDAPAPAGGASDASAKAAYLERANAVCARIGTRTDALPEPRFPEPGAARDDPSVRAFERDQARFERDAGAILRDGLRDLRAIPPPPGDERRLAALYEELERALAALTALPAERPGDPADDPTARFRRDAAAYGLKACA